MSSYKKLAESYNLTSEMIQALSGTFHALVLRGLVHPYLEVLTDEGIKVREALRFLAEKGRKS